METAGATEVVVDGGALVTKGLEGVGDEPLSAGLLAMTTGKNSWREISVWKARSDTAVGVSRNGRARVAPGSSPSPRSDFYVCFNLSFTDLSCISFFLCRFLKSHLRIGVPSATNECAFSNRTGHESFHTLPLVGR